MEPNKPKWTRRKILHLILSFLFACAIWIYVDGADNPDGSERTKTISNIPIIYTEQDASLADRGLMLLPGSDESVTLEIKARRWVLARLDPSEIRIRADLSNLSSIGVHSVSYTVDYPANVSRSAISIVNASRYLAQVKLGELYSRNVEIRCAVEGSVAPGYIAGELQLSPAELEIRGPREDVDKVAYAKVTLQLENATQTVTQTLDYELYDQQDHLIEDLTNLHATSDQIQVTVPVNVEKELPLVVDFIESNGARVGNLDYAITPASITVSGDAELLKDVQSIVLDQLDLAEFSEPNTYRFPILLPAGVENLSGTTRATMTIQFKDMTTATVHAVKFRCENVPAGKTVTILTSLLPVTIRGTGAAVASVTDRDLTVVADLTNVNRASGSYTVPATIEVTNGADVGVRGKYQIRLTISDQSTPSQDPDDGLGVPITPVTPVQPVTPVTPADPGDGEDPGASVGGGSDPAKSADGTDPASSASSTDPADPAKSADGGTDPGAASSAPDTT